MLVKFIYIYMHGNHSFMSKINADAKEQACVSRIQGLITLRLRCMMMMMTELSEVLNYLETGI